MIQSLLTVVELNNLSWVDWDLTVFLLPKSCRKYSHTNSYIFVMTVISQYDNLTAGAWAACSPFQLDNATENQKENENAPNLRFSRSDLLHQSLSWFLWHTLGVLDRTEKDPSPSEVIHPQLPPQ